MLTNVQSLRFFAALAVVFYHGTPTYKHVGGAANLMRYTRCNSPE